MTNMKRRTFCIPDDLDKAVLELRKNDKYVGYTYGKIIRHLIAIGLQAEKSKNA